MFDKLHENSVIELIAPASGIKNSDVKKFISDVKNFISYLGYVPLVDENVIISDKEDLYFSNILEYRINSLKNSIYSDSSDAIWCLRGGYGSATLIPYLDELSSPKKNKILIGFSDITALHIYFNQKWNMPTLHYKVLTQLRDISKIHEQEIFILKTILHKMESSVSYDITPINKLAENTNLLSGKLIGGNMCIIENSIGTSWQIDTRDKILFLEEINEENYKIDRMLEHYKQSGILKGAKAIIFGDLLYKESEKNYIDQFSALKRFIDSTDIPLYKIKDIGHGEVNLPILLGTYSEIRNNLLEVSIE